MNNEQLQQELLEEAYQVYIKKYDKDRKDTKQQFVNSLLFFPDFAKLFGVRMYGRKDEEGIWVGVEYNGRVAEVLEEPTKKQ